MEHIKAFGTGLVLVCLLATNLLALWTVASDLYSGASTGWFAIIGGALVPVLALLAGTFIYAIGFMFRSKE